MMKLMNVLLLAAAAWVLCSCASTGSSGSWGTLSNGGWSGSAYAP